MPQLFRIGPYIVYFWSNEGIPQKPVHVHIVDGKPTANATKFWITRSGKTILANNNSRFQINSCVCYKELSRPTARISWTNGRSTSEKLIFTVDGFYPAN